MRTVIFDLDGTLADTSGDLIAAANVCFEEMGHAQRLDPVADALTAFHGGRAMLRLGLGRGTGRDGAAADEAQVDRWYPRLLTAYGAAIDVHTRLYPGAIEAVEALRASGHAVGICTNKPAGLAEDLLARLGVRGLFASLIGADSLPVRKPDPAPYVAAVEGAGGTVARSLLVGDTDTDRKTARAAGVPCVLVGFGPEGTAVSRLEPEAMIAHFDALPEVVARLLA
ncbi:HAD-IA family hydrolase [Salipiger sp.]|uniref:HAD-IA family hydrolase n=1 Tax=Salipiger sp. TaxID=2078585 RepID=UPI003A96EA1A